MPLLLVHQNDGQIIRVPILKQTFKIGRVSQCDLVFDQMDISRNHAEIYFFENRYYLKDLSTAGTFLNDKKISMSPLKTGDKIKVGQWVIDYQDESIEEKRRAEEAKTRWVEVQALSEKTKIHQAEPKEKIDSLWMTTAEGLKEISLQNGLTLGTALSNDLILKDEFASKEHARFEINGSDVYLVDLDSTNGTKVNGEKIKRAKLKLGDEILLGQTQFTFGLPPVKPLDGLEFCGMVGQSPSMKKLFERIQQVALYPMSVMIYGESGCGKELVTKAIHDLSSRREQPYVVINCGAISPQLIESELFGHEKGAFTGALSKRLGVFEQAQGGTLFLDEIGELPLDLQPKLLRALENRVIRRVGGDVDVQLDVRVLAATHRNLIQQVENKDFRQDLFYRLNVLPLDIDPLRERSEDIPLLCQKFMESFEGGPQKVKITSKAMDKLKAYSWPGNVRELKNVLFRALVFGQAANEIDDASIMFDAINHDDVVHFDLQSVEKKTILSALDKSGGNKAKAADLLGIARSTLFKKIKEYEIESSSE